MQKCLLVTSISESDLGRIFVDPDHNRLPKGVPLMIQSRLTVNVPTDLLLDYLKKKKVMVTFEACYVARFEKRY